MGVVELQIRVAAQQQTQTETTAGDALRGTFAWQRMVAAQPGRVIEGQRAALIAERHAAPVRRVQFQVQVGARIIRYFALGKAPYGRGAAGAELLAGHQRVRRDLGIEQGAPLPVAGQHAARAGAQPRRVVGRLGVRAHAVEIGLRAVLSARDIVREGDRHAALALGQRPGADIGDAERVHGDVGAQLHAEQLHAVAVSLVIDAVHELGFEIAAAGKVLVVADAGHAALAADGQVENTGRNAARIDVRIAGKKIHRVAQRIQRQVVAGAIHAHLVGLFQTARVLQAGDVVTAQQVGMLQHHAHVRLARLGIARIVHVEHGLPRPFIGHRDDSIDGARRLVGLQAHFDLARRIFIGQLQALRQGRQIRRLAFAEKRQGTPHVGVVHIGIAADGDLAQRRLQHVQAHHAPLQFLLRQLHLHGAVATLAVSPFQHLDGAGNIGKIALRPRKRRQQGLHLGVAEQGVSLHIKAADGEARHAVLLRARRGLIHGNGSAGGADGEQQRGTRKQVHQSICHVKDFLCSRTRARSRRYHGTVSGNGLKTNFRRLLVSSQKFLPFSCDFHGGHTIHHADKREKMMQQTTFSCQIKTLFAMQHRHAIPVRWRRCKAVLRQPLSVQTVQSVFGEVRLQVRHGGRCRLPLPCAQQREGLAPAR